MSERLKITRMEVYEFENEMPDVVNQAWSPGATGRPVWRACRIVTDRGVVGEHFTWGGRFDAVRQAAPYLIGRDALEREAINRALKASPGLSIIDNTLWDIAGKYYNEPVYRLLGASRTRLPVYASTLFGDENKGGLNSPEAYADFSEECLEMGYPGFKIHPWKSRDVERDVALILAVGRRVGGKMALMYDGSFLYGTFAQVLRVGKACDEAGFAWYEDPAAGVPGFSYKRLREMIQTPLLLGEHTRGLEDEAGLVIAGATDIMRGDADSDGITVTMKRAHLAEALGIDIELHGWTPAQAHCVAAISNTNYLELSLVHPHVRYEACPFMAAGHEPPKLDDIGSDGCVPMGEGVGLGVPINWDYVRSHAIGSAVIE